MARDGSARAFRRSGAAVKERFLFDVDAKPVRVDGEP